MSTCDTCKHWAPYGSKNVPKYPPHMSLCWHLWVGPVNPDGTERTDYLSTMSLGRAVTGPKFGCVHHEPK